MKQLNCREVSFDTPTGRPLIHGLNMALRREHVAVVGRNGVGKSTLLEILSGELLPKAGRVRCTGRRELVRQTLADRGEGVSPGELRRSRLQGAFARQPDFLLLDEPSQELDSKAIRWLRAAFEHYAGSLVVVTHDRQLLRYFDAFFVVAESGCRLVTGGFQALLSILGEAEKDATRRYLAELAQMEKKEIHNSQIRRRRARKRAGGRVRELGRCPARANLNAKRGYAEVYQGKREGVREERIAAARQLAKASRRALAVELPLSLPELSLSCGSSAPVVTAKGIRSAYSGQVTFPRESFAFSRERVAITGSNGTGKSTLLRVLTGELAPDQGAVETNGQKVGYVAQHAENWKLEDDLASLLVVQSDAASPEFVATLLAEHRFPLALAQRPLKSLSPGERTRAALTSLFYRRPQIEMLVLDEPTAQLDLLGLAALEEVLTAWRGGLLVVSHDEEFLEHIAIQRRIVMG